MPSLACGLALAAVLAAALAVLPAAAATAVPAAPATNAVLRPDTPVAEVTFVAFDTETTGLNAARDRLVEVAAVKFRRGQVLAEKTWLINPGRPIPPAAQAVHHITDAMVRGQPDFKTVYPAFEQFCRGAVLLAHNAHFDVSFVSAECARNGLPSPANLCVDTLPLSRVWFPDLASHSIGSLSTNLQLNAGGFHRALSDTMYLMLIFEWGRRQQPPGWTLDALFRAGHPPLRFTPLSKP